MAGFHMENKDGFTHAAYFQFAQDVASDKDGIHEVCDVFLDRIKSALPYFEGNYDPHAYIEWELAVDNEFDKHDLSEQQMIFAASSALTKYALDEWKHICRHNKIPQSWHGFKVHFRDIYIPSYYADDLLAKLAKLEQGSRTVKAYCHVFNICRLFGGLDACMADVMTMFLNGLNSEIRTTLIHETYSHISHLFLLASIAEKQILLSQNTCNNNVIHANLVSSTSHADEDAYAPIVPPYEPVALVHHLSTTSANIEQSIEEPFAEFPLSQIGVLAVPCDKEELCGNAALVFRAQLRNKSKNFEPMSAEFMHVVHTISKNDEAQLLSSLHTMGYIEFDDLCDLNSLEKKLLQNYDLLSFDRYSFHATRKYDNDNKYMVDRVYICSDSKNPSVASPSYQLMTCIEANHAISSFSTIDYKLQLNFQEGEQVLLLCTSIGVPGVYLEDIDKILFQYFNHNDKPRTVCCQEGENDEDMTRSDTTTLKTSKRKVKSIHVRFTFYIFEQLRLHNDFCALSFSEVLAWIKGRFDCIWNAWKVNEVDWRPNLSVPNVLHQPTTSLLAQGKKESKSNTFGKRFVQAGFGIGLQDSPNL
jgi:hypothetical protein